jgi:hypothetical protein
MRLTLRTLLAYLDDTLEPTEAKAIGQKVAESDTAQELIARIREVTRRRRITTPTATSAGAKVDPNTIAEYLDNELSADALAEVEQLALASDVHLAEIAACHQILTVVLGEPAMVPPTAYKRMYGLVKPPEGNPHGQPPVRRRADEALPEGKEVDETLRLGLPALRSGGGWGNRLILVAGAACILLLLGVAIWMVIPPSREGSEPVAKGSLLPPTGSEKKDRLRTDTGKKDTEVNKKQVEDKEKDKDKDKDKGNGKDKDEKKDPEPKKLPEEIPPANLVAVQDVGLFEPPSPPATAVLLQRKEDGKTWARLIRSDKPARVLTNRPLVSLPGYRSVVQLDNGLRLTLWGNLPEIWPFPLAFESRVVLHPSDQVDLDFTLERGRVALTNPKDNPLKVRLRFANPANPEKGEAWEIILVEKNTEVIANLAGAMPVGELFFPAKTNPQRKGPLAVLVLVVTSGSASVKIDFQTIDKLTPPPEGPMLAWLSKEGVVKTFPQDALPPWTQEKPPLPKGFEAKQRITVMGALSPLSTELSGSAVDTGLLNALKPSNDVQVRRLAVRAAGAMDDLQRVIDLLQDKDLDVRRAAVETLRIWIAGGWDHDYKLFDTLQTIYTRPESEIIMSLLHYYSPDQDRDPALHAALCQYLVHKKVAIRELAHDYLLRIRPDGIKIGYSAVAPEADVRQRAAVWQAFMTPSDKK